MKFKITVPEGETVNVKTQKKVKFLGVDDHDLPVMGWEDQSIDTVQSASRDIDLPSGSRIVIEA